MNGIPDKVLEEKIEKILDKKINQKKDEIYRDVVSRLGIQKKMNDLLARAVRVEESLKNQQDTIEKLIHQIDKRFEQVDKRFEDVNKRFEQQDKRFEDMNKRFNMLTWFMGIGFTITISLIVTILNFIMK